MKKILIALVLILLFALPGWGATYYVSPSGSNTSPYDTFEKARTTIASAISGASNGDIIEISGGVSGQTYSENLNTSSKSIAIRGSRQSGHSGRVLISATDGSIGLSIGGSVNISNIDWEWVADAGSDTPIYISAGTSVLDNVNIRRIVAPSLSNGIQVVGAGTSVVWKNSAFKDISSSSALTPALVRLNNATASATFAYNTFQYAGQLYVNAGTLNLYNNTMATPWPKTWPSSTPQYFTRAASGATLVSKNNVYMGGVACQSIAGATITSDRDMWHPRDTGAITTFDSANVGTVTNPITPSPLAWTHRPSDLGQAFVLLDDSGTTSDAEAFANISGDVRVSLAVTIHGGYNNPSAANLAAWRRMVKTGHSIAAHGSTHSTFITLDAIKISATGTSPTISISASRSGDSDTWTGTLTITINGTVLSVDLANASYDTIAELIAYLNNRSVGDGTVTAVKATTNHSGTLKSLCLEDVSELSIAAQQTLTFNEAAYIRFEAVECIMDLAAYIMTGTDRNGNNAVVSAETPPVSYTVQQYRTAYGETRPALLTELATGPHGIILGVQVFAKGGADVWGQGDATNGLINVYGWGYAQIDSDAETYASIINAWAGPRVYMLLWHSTPTYNGSADNLLALLNTWGLGTETPESYFARFRTSGQYTDQGGGNWLYVGDGADMHLQDFRPSSGSPTINAGVDVGLTTDADGKPIAGKPDIGAYERQGRFFGF